MIKSTLSLLLLAAMLSLALAEEPEPLGQDCFNCRCVRNIDYQVGLSHSLSLPRTVLVVISISSAAQTEGITRTNVCFAAPRRNVLQKPGESS